MKRNYFMAVVAGSLLMLTSLQSCIHESLETEVTNVNEDPLTFIRSEYMRGKDMVGGKQIEWEKARKYNGEDDRIILVTVPIKNSKSNIIEELTFRIDNNKVSGHLWMFESDKGFTASDYGLPAHEIMNKITGNVSYVALEGSMRYKMKIVEGQFIEELAAKHGGIITPQCKPCHGEIGEIIITPPSGGGGPVNPFPPDNPSIPIPTIVIPPPKKPDEPQNQNGDPCAKIKKQKGTADYNQKINDLKGKTGQQKETGYSQKANGEYTYHDKATTNSDSNSLSLPTSTDINGYMHTHVDDFSIFDNEGNEGTRKGIKMFSPADVSYFMDMLSNAQAAGRPLGDVYAVMVTSTGTYQLMFTGTPGQIKTFTKQQVEALKGSYKDAMGNLKHLESNFLKFLKDKMGLEGVNLYRTQQVGKTTEIKLNSDRSIAESDCPQ